MRTFLETKKGKTQASSLGGCASRDYTARPPIKAKMWLFASMT
jgi:hypothetical protein